MKLNTSIVGTGIGAGIGGYLSSVSGNILYCGIGAGAGFLVGGLIEWFYPIWRWKHKKKNRQNKV